MSADPSDEKADPQVMPDKPSRDDEPKIEDPDLASGHRYGPGDDAAAPHPSE